MTVAGQHKIGVASAHRTGHDSTTSDVAPTWHDGPLTIGALASGFDSGWSAYFELEIKPPKHGWAETTLTLGGTEVFIDTSDVGPDSFAQLVDAAIFAACAHSGSKTVEFFEEPGGHILQVTPDRAGTVTVTLSSTPSLFPSDRMPATEVARVQAGAREFALAVWRGLRANEQTIRAAHSEGHWGPFPETEMEALRDALERGNAATAAPR